MPNKGIPESITLESVREYVRPKVSMKRFLHIEGVVEVAESLAREAGCNVFYAQLAGWLHDACKEMKSKELVEKALQFGMPLTDMEKRNGHLLHGPVAAALAQVELDINNQEVLNAIAEHTLGAVPMSDLSKVLYLADCLEDSRPKDYTRPIWKALNLKSKMNMDAAIVVACDLGIQHLLESGKPIHPKTVEVRNYYLKEVD